jgi:hypothetical protein
VLQHFLVMEIVQSTVSSTDPKVVGLGLAIFSHRRSGSIRQD